MRNRCFRLSVLLQVFIASAWFGDNEVRSQPPYELPQNATEDDLQEVVVPLSDAVKRKIAEALSKQSSPATGDQSTGDPILDDVLNVIRRQGSLLDGSSLDPRNLSDASPERQFRPSTDPSVTDQPGVDQSDTARPRISLADQFPGGSRRKVKASAEGPDDRFAVAESLLRAARKLAMLPGGDPQRQRLIAGMREQATVLMIDEFSQSATETR
jgi:hypothetical protein